MSSDPKVLKKTRKGSSSATVVANLLANAGSQVGSEYLNGSPPGRESGTPLF